MSLESSQKFSYFIMIFTFLTNLYLIEEPPYAIEGAPFYYGPGFFRLGGFISLPEAAR